MVFGGRALDRFSARRVFLQERRIDNYANEEEKEEEEEELKEQRLKPHSGRVNPPFSSRPAFARAFFCPRWS